MKKIFLFMMLTCISICSFAQETSLEVDCQIPGWLSSLITYGNQQTIQNLKVTGYINSTDLKFIGQMMSKQSLRGCIDLEDANIVGTTTSTDNVMPENSFNISSDLQISHIKFPLSMTKGKACLGSDINVETITIGGESMPCIDGTILFKAKYSGGDGLIFNKKVKHLILREGVTEIANNSFCTYKNISKEECIFSSVQFPSTLKTIGKYAFRYNYALNIDNLPNNLESIDTFAFGSTSFTPETLTLPNSLKYYHTSAIQSSVLYFGTEITEINNTYKDINTFDEINGDEIIIHIAAITPPKFTYVNVNCLNKCIIYVQKNSVDLYKAAFPWKYATILAEPNPATSIKLDIESIELTKGNTKKLNAVILPLDADSKDVTWSSSNTNVAEVSPEGIVTAVSSGNATIFVELIENNALSASCEVKVTQPVTDLYLSAREKTLKVGDVYTLTTTISPYDANNKNVIWTTSNSELATVENGTITTLKPGNVRITATSENNPEISDYCDIAIEQPAIGIELNHNSYTLGAIGETLELNATVHPEDASNKEVNWKSSNENVCIVSNGSVVAVGYGQCVIIATTVDGGHMATCTVTVENTSSINNIQLGESQGYKVYDIDGKPSSLATKGIKVIRFSNGESQKIVMQ